MRLKGSGKIVGGLVLAAGFALTGVVGVAAQQGQDGGGQGRAERPWGHKEGRGGGRRGGFGRFAELNLTDAQQEQLRQIEERYRAAFRAQRGSRGREREGFDPFAGGAFDEAAVRADARARADAQVEREVAQARMMHEMYNVLTAEQKAQLASARQQRRQEFRTRRGAGQGQQQQWQ
ncbi:MAG TPA: Spy/CpxP family protein refolding chaperone [Pyrinomonadaceae bacterium]|jgi:protein CpxP